MPRLIFKCPYIKPGMRRAAAHLNNYVRYMATRDGAEQLTPGKAGLPATKNQQAMIERLLRDFPMSRGMFEYEDYQAHPTRGNASEFITRALEDNYDEIAKRENYVDYIAQRPRAEHIGSHALFTGEDAPLVLSQIADEVAHHPGNMWLPIISLRREDAARLGYDSAQRWRTLLCVHAPEIAKAMKIPWKEFRWYAAFHNEGQHPHVHMVCYSADGKSGFLSKEGIAAIKSGLVKDIFKQELTELYQGQTRRRDELTAQARQTMGQLIAQMELDTLDNPRIEELTANLSQQLRAAKGKKVYGYLKPNLKAVVDEIVDELAKDPRVAHTYDLWYTLREEVLRSYKDDLPARLPLSQQKEFKSIKNMVIQEALRLGQMELSEEQIPDPPLPDAPVPEIDRTPLDDNGLGNYQGSHSPDADSHDDKFQYRLGWMKLHGVGTEQDEVEAREWFEKAARLGNPYTQYQLARLILADDGASQEELEQAAAWLTKSAGAGLDCAQYALGKLYRDGRGVEKDILQAVTWFSEAAEQGNGLAAYALGKLYLTGEDAPKNMEAALRWLERSAGLGNQYALYKLGVVYLKGEDVPKDIDKAVEYLTASADQGSQYAQYQLGKLYLLGREAEKDEATALQWLTQSAQQGNEHAQWFLDHWNEFRGPTPFQCAARLLYHLGRVFQEQTPRPALRVEVDKKLRQRIREKKIAMGHKADDHEEQVQHQM